MGWYRRICSSLLAACLATTAGAAANEAPADLLHACDRAAAHAEAEWHLPAGVLSAIGIVESGRSALAGGRPIPWPWSVNADGHGYFMPEKTDAIAAVRALQSIGRRAIDVGCFQVDLFYHPEAFASLEAAFDPEANAQAAARILATARFGSTSWETAIALYHSASPILGAVYLRQVQAAWPWARNRTVADDLVYAVLLSPAARQVRVIYGTEAPASPPGDLPRVIGPRDSASVVQWTSSPRELPIVLMPPVNKSSHDRAHRLIE